MQTIRNFSRHGLTEDQAVALATLFPDREIGEPEAPFFGGAVDLADKVSGQAASLVAPWDMILEAMAGGLFEDGTVLIAWRADQNARKRGRFAARGMTTFEIVDGRPVKGGVVEIEPTEEMNFRDGEKFPYEG